MVDENRMHLIRAVHMVAAQYASSSLFKLTPSCPPPGPPADEPVRKHPHAVRHEDELLLPPVVLEDRSGPIVRAKHSGPGNPSSFYREVKQNLLDMMILIRMIRMIKNLFSLIHLGRLDSRPASMKLTSH